ncbi:hypothetical protein GQ457_06G007090 [Hibiscus cannabinus]
MVCRRFEGHYRQTEICSRTITDKKLQFAEIMWMNEFVNNQNESTVLGRLLCFPDNVSSKSYTFNHHYEMVGNAKEKARKLIVKCSGV